ncbi:hypothetical protein GH975_06170 [Litorivicinus lipolyticus]|uniref:Uncharacterized protein n=1 Tax=Litorivicinus lipolyticus TaxID=418701 RepID=A0A5Q2QCW8_9GAMM|nr:hypothetical protein [Litorivicinus lipolyticus]QGG80181.1 hypothetical protein GH975_06170 [Litorivicinus lipolyticus]
MCKGVERRLPDGISFKDKGGVKRHEGRLAWWNQHPDGWRDHLRIPSENWPKALDTHPFDMTDEDDWQTGRSAFGRSRSYWHVAQQIRGTLE